MIPNDVLFVWPDSVEDAFMWERNEEHGVRYVVSPNGCKFECTKDGEVYDGTGDAGWSGTGEEPWNFDCDEEGFTLDSENDGEELGGVDAGDGEVDADEDVDVEQDGEDESWEKGENTNVDCEEDGDDEEEGDGCEGEGEDDEGEDE